jgi:uncharacterized membrane protein YfcA
MCLKNYLFCVFAGLIAGCVTGLFGGGGGMVLIPLLCWLTEIEEDAVFPTSVCVILPVCLVCLLFRQQGGALPWQEAMPYLIGSAVGGIATGLWGQKIPTLWLHRLLGVMILWGGIRYLC